MTEASGLGFAGFCHGVVVGDIDNDGDQDVFLCNYGPNVLYLNNGDGTFRRQQGGGHRRLETGPSGGAFLDYDNDGDLDLYVTQLRPVEAARRRPVLRRSARRCGSTASPRIKPVQHLLYRNNGDRHRSPT